jgi:hypothetical protein
MIIIVPITLSSDRNSPKKGLRGRATGIGAVNASSKTMTTFARD